MKKTTKIIISVAAALVLVAGIVAASLFMNKDKIKGDNTTAGTTGIQTTGVSVTESYWDFNAYLSQMGATTETSGVITDVNGSIIDPLATVATDANGSVINPSNVVTQIVNPYTSIIYINSTNAPTVTAAPTTTKKVTVADTTPEMVEYTYSIDKSQKTVTLKKYIGSDSTPVIPSKVGGCNVTAIGSGCFKGKGITSVYIPKTVSTIDSSAFSGCKNLKTVYCMGAEDIYIGASAFEGCSSLKTVALSTSTQSIGSNCFSNCSSLTSITIPETVTSIGANAFSGCPDSLVIKCKAGSVAEETAIKYSISYEHI